MTSHHFTSRYLTGRALLCASLIFFAPLALHAAALININTASEATLETLPGIGPSKANAIITYRTQHGDFKSISAIQDVSGIGPATYANIAPLITVDAGSSPSSETTTTTSTHSSSSSSSASSANASQSAAATTVMTVEPGLFIKAGGDRTTIAGADTAYTANVAEASGAAALGAVVRWSWGDGSQSVGASVNKSYALPGTYIVSYSAATSLASGEGSFMVTVTDAQVSVTSNALGIALKNSGADTLDLSHWQLAAGGGVFAFPQGTKIAAGASVTFAPEITGLTNPSSATLYYPSGKVAASSGGVGTAQPSQVPASSHEGQSITSSAHTHVAATAVSAPAAPAITAAAGAALPAEAASAGKHGLVSRLTSPWVLGSLGLLVFSAGAFILL